MLRGDILRKILVFIGGLLLIGLFGYSYLRTDFKADIMESLVFEGEAKGESIELTLWKDETDGKYYMFVPSWFYGERSRYTLYYPQGSGCVLIDGIRYENGDVWEEKGTEEIHEVEIRGAFKEDKEGTKFSLQVLASQNLPSIFIAVEEKDGVISDVEFDNKQYLEAGYMEVRDADGALMCRQELERFKVRGNWTATLEKKPYELSMKDDVALLGMEAASNWNLLANATDGSYIRNKLTRDLAYECIDTYEPQGEFADLYLNGEYQGLYLLTETVEIAENRLDIDENNSWFVELELEVRAMEEMCVVTSEGQYFVVHTPVGATERELSQIQESLNDIESALYADDGISKLSGKKLEELIDLESFAEVWLIEELTGDADVGLTSQFMYLTLDEVSYWHAGPTWDFDCIMGNADTPMYKIPSALTASIQYSRAETSGDQNRWFSALWKHTEFQNVVIDKYKEVFRETYVDIYSTKIDQYVTLIQRAATLDALRWHEDRIDWWFLKIDGLSFLENDTYARYDTLKESVDIVKEYMAQKLIFLDKLWIENKEFCIVEIRNSVEFLDPWYNQTLYYWVEKNTPIDKLPCYETDKFSFDGYYHVVTGELITNGTIIHEDCVIEGKWTKE